MLKHPAPRADTGWLASDGGFTGAAWFAPNPAHAGAAAVLIVPGIAHEERTMADGLAALARSLSNAGHGTLLIDLHGTAQSSGRLDTPRIGAHWRDDVRAALRCLRGAGHEQVIVVGVRLGALIALDALRHEHVDALVAWSPVVSGRRHVRELRMLQGGGPGGGGERGGSADGAALSIAGHSIPAPVLAHLSTLDFVDLAAGAPGRVLLLDRPEQLAAGWTARFGSDGQPVDRVAATELDRWLSSPNRMPALPLADIERVTAWCGRLPACASTSPRCDPPLLHEIVLTGDDGQRVRERTVRIEPEGLSAIVSEPADRPARGATRLLATLVGPGRMFPEFARAEASRGKSSLRFDFAGFSTSLPRADGSGGALYALANRVDVIAALAWLRRAGHAKVVMVGFCAGAWSMVHAGAVAAEVPGVVGLVGINVALYRQPDYTAGDYLLRAGHPVSKALALLRRIERLAPLVDRLERRATLALSPSRWLQRLCASNARVLLVYGVADHGLAHLERQCGPHLEALRHAGRVQVNRYGELGHLTEGPSARAQALRDIATFIDGIDATDVLDVIHSNAAEREPGVTVPASAPANRPRIRAGAQAASTDLPTAARSTSTSP